MHSFAIESESEKEKGKVWVELIFERAFIVVTISINIIIQNANLIDNFFKLKQNGVEIFQ